MVQKENTEYIAFHGEHSLWSNFHLSPFVLNGQQYHSAEQWIQYQKAMLFGDSHTANCYIVGLGPNCKFIDLLFKRLVITFNKISSFIVFIVSEIICSQTDTLTEELMYLR